MSNHRWLPILFLSMGLSPAILGMELGQLGKDRHSPERSLSIRTPHATADSIDGVTDRLPDWVSAQFTSIEVDELSGISEGFARVTGSAEEVNIVASSPVDALYAVHAFLREFCRATVTWDGDSLPQKGQCKRPEQFEREFTAPKVRFFGNMAHSFDWFDWPEWERFIDVLAMNGFNSFLIPPKLMTPVWSMLWKQFGLNNVGQDISDGLSVSDAYFDKQLRLSKKIMKKLAVLGIVPVLPTFGGSVPEQFAQKFPGLRYLRHGCASENNNCTAVSLHPVEPEFMHLSKMLINIQSSIYGNISDVYYASDPFAHDQQHLQDDEGEAMASAIFHGCAHSNPRCVWLLQSSVLSNWKSESVEAFLDNVPKGRLLILDEAAEEKPVYKKLNHFYGHQFVWCLHHGGSAQMRGNLGRLHEAYRSARTSERGMVGMGITTKGMGHNYVVYQYFVDISWSDKEINPHQWVLRYAAARYGALNEQVERAWRLLHATFYTQLDFEYDPNHGHGLFSMSEAERRLSEAEKRREIFIYSRPELAREQASIRYWFPRPLLAKLSDAFAVLNGTLSGNPLFRQDLAAVRREIIQMQVANRIVRAEDGYGMDDKKVIRKACKEMASLFEVLDSNEVRDLREWTRMARRAATSHTEADQFEAQSRRQLILIGDSAWRGLIRTFHANRWNCYCEYLQSGVRFNQKKFNSKVHREVEEPFSRL